MLQTLFQRFARYNAWANRRLYAACAELDPAEYHRQRPAFFGSIHRTLNHILVADRLWVARIEGRTPPALALDTELYPTLPELRAAREAEDAGLLALVDGLDEAALVRKVSYRTIKGEPYTDDVATILQHTFNHHTHHRGQVHDMLVATPVPPPPLDLAYFVREDDAAQR